MGKRKKVKQRSIRSQLQLGDAFLVDRISQLPDEILVCIISCLNLRDAAICSLVSKRWRYLWTFTSNLVFDGLDAKWENEAWWSTGVQSKFVTWVNHVFELHQGPSIDAFRVRYGMVFRQQSSIDKLIDFAFAKRTLRLELDFCTTSTQNVNYTYIPGPNVLSSFNSLRSLALKYLNVTGETLELILFNCRLLEQLCVSGLDHLVNLKVDDSLLHLNYLEISNCQFLKNVEICAPNLVRFKYFGASFRLHVHVKNVPMLVDVTIGGNNHEDAIRIFQAFGNYLSQLETLRMILPLLRSVAYLQLPQCELTRLKDLTLEIRAADSQVLLGFTRVIHAAPSLHKFTLLFQWKGPPGHRSTRMVFPRCRHQHLKAVEVFGFVGRPVDVELVLYLIKNAAVLEKFIIHLNDRYKVGEPLQSEMKLEAKERAEKLKKQLHRKRVEMTIL